MIVSQPVPSKIEALEEAFPSEGILRSETESGAKLSR